MEKYYLHEPLYVEELPNGKRKVQCLSCGKVVEGPVSKQPCINENDFLPGLNGAIPVVVATPSFQGMAFIDATDGMRDFKFRFLRVTNDSSVEVVFELYALAVEQVVEKLQEEKKGQFLVPGPKFLSLFEKAIKSGKLKLQPLKGLEVDFGEFYDPEEVPLG